MTARGNYKSGRTGAGAAKPSAREQILDVALDLFNAQGSGEVTTNQIAAAAGRSPGNLYYHFANKEEIVRHLFERLVAQWAVVYALPSDRAPGMADIERMVEGNFAVLWQFRFIYRDLQGLLQRDGVFREAFLAERNRGFDNFRLLLGHFAAVGVIAVPESDAETEELAQLLWIVGDYWLAFVETGRSNKTTPDLSKGVALFRRVLKPYVRISQ